MQPASKVSIVSLDQHKVFDAIEVAQARAIVTRVADTPGCALIVCSYAPVGSGNRPRTLNFVQQLSRFTSRNIGLVHTASKVHGPGSKAAFLSALFDQLRSLLDSQPLDVWHVDDSFDIVGALSRLNNPAIRGQLAQSVSATLWKSTCAGTLSSDRKNERTLGLKPYIIQLCTCNARGS